MAARFRLRVGGPLGISAKTVGRHIDSLSATAGVSSGAAAAVFAIEYDIMT
jgi:DNA-binding NarL/FixJ family response regulator